MNSQISSRQLFGHGALSNAPLKIMYVFKQGKRELMNDIHETYNFKNPDRVDTTIDSQHTSDLKISIRYVLAEMPPPSSVENDRV